MTKKVNRYTRGFRNLYRLARAGSTSELLRLGQNYSKVIQQESISKWRSILIERNVFWNSEYKIIQKDFADFPLILKLANQIYSWGEQSHALYRIIIDKDSQQRDELSAEIRLAKPSTLHPLSRILLNVIEGYSFWVDGDFPKLVNTVEISDIMTLDLDKLSKPLQVLVETLKYCSVNDLGKSNVLAKSTKTVSDQSTSNTIILVEGIIPPEDIKKRIDELYPDVSNILICFLSRPAGLITEYTKFFALDDRISFPDLLVDFTGNYVPRIRPSSSFALEFATKYFKELLNNSASQRNYDRLAFYHESLTLSIDDQVYRYLRIVCALETVFEHFDIDSAYYETRTAGYLLPTLAILFQNLEADKVNFSLKLKSAGLQRKFIKLSNDIYTKSEFKNFSSVAAPEEFHSKLSFNSESGPTMPDLFFKQPNWSDISQNLKQNPLTSFQSETFETLIETIAIKQLPENEAFICICANLDDRVSGGLALELLVNLSSSGNHIIFYNFSDINSPKLEQLRAQVSDQSKLVVLNFRSLQSKVNEKFETDINEISPPELTLNSIDKPQNPFNLSQDLIDLYTETLIETVAKRVLPSHLKHTICAEQLFATNRIAKLIIFPTRNTYMRVVAQAARLHDVPSLEIQTVLGGKMVRHRRPNTTYCSVLEHWSADYYEEYLKYPRDRILLGGSWKYDKVLRTIREKFQNDTVLRRRQELVGNTGCNHVILYGTQPMEVSDNLKCLEAICESIHGKDVFLIIKSHPFEPEENMKQYTKIVSEFNLTATSLVTSSLDIYEAIVLSDITIAQTSNILVEAAILGKRALSINMGDYTPPVDFQDMGAALILTTAADLKREISHLISHHDKITKLDEIQSNFTKRNPQLFDCEFNKRLLKMITSL